MYLAYTDKLVILHPINLYTFTMTITWSYQDVSSLELLRSGK